MRERREPPPCAAACGPSDHRCRILDRLVVADRVRPARDRHQRRQQVLAVRPRRAARSAGRPASPAPAPRRCAPAGPPPGRGCAPPAPSAARPGTPRSASARTVGSRAARPATTRLCGISARRNGSGCAAIAAARIVVSSQPVVGSAGSVSAGGSVSRISRRPGWMSADPPRRRHQLRLRLARQHPRREVLLQQLVAVQHLVRRRVLVQHAQRQPRPARCPRRAGGRQQLQRRVVVDPHLARLAVPPRSCMPYASAASVGEQRPPLRQLVRRRATATGAIRRTSRGSASSSSGAKQRVVALHLALQRLPHEAGEQRRPVPRPARPSPPTWSTSSARKNGAAQRLQLRRPARWPPRSPRRAPGCSSRRNSLHLLVGQRLDLHLRHPQRRRRQRRAVVQLRQAEHRPGCPGRSSTSRTQPVLPQPDPLAVTRARWRRGISFSASSSRTTRPAAKQLVQRRQLG